MPEFAKGLEGVIAAESRICWIDGTQGKLYYLGYSIEDLVEHCSFEEVTYLLLNARLPKRDELDAFTKDMRSQRALPEPVQKMIREFPASAHPMELLQAVIPYLSGYSGPKETQGPDFDSRRTIHQIAQLPSVVAAWHRCREGKDIVQPRTDLSHGANFLYMLNGEEPGELEGRIMDGALVLHAEHSFNASTFTARVVASTQSTVYCSVSAAIGSLYGSLHGGANERVMEMVDEIGSKDNAEAWVNKALDEKRKVMGMGHRVYRAKDPRATIIEGYLKELGKKSGDLGYYEIMKEIERAFRDRMEEKGKPIYPNVDFFSGAVYRQLGIPTVLFTPIFAIARISGWISHIMEQRRDNRIYRPKALYTGDAELEFVPLDKR